MAHTVKKVSGFNCMKTAKQIQIGLNMAEIDHFVSITGFWVSDKADRQKVYYFPKAGLNLDYDTVEKILKQHCGMIEKINNKWLTSFGIMDKRYKNKKLKPMDNDVEIIFHIRPNQFDLIRNDVNQFNMKD